jgi:hypothetical protein
MWFGQRLVDVPQVEQAYRGDLRRRGAGFSVESTLLKRLCCEPSEWPKPCYSSNSVGRYAAI